MKVFGSLETEGILGIELGVNSAKGEICVVLGDIMIAIRRKKRCKMI